MQTRTIPGQGSAVRIVLPDNQGYNYRIDFDKLRRCHYNFEYCGFGFTEISELVEHVEQVHRPPGNPSQTRATGLTPQESNETDPIESAHFYGMKAFECPFSPSSCGRSFKSFNSCFNHSLTHFKGMHPPKRNHCPFCGAIFSSDDGRRTWQYQMEHAEIHRAYGERLYTNLSDFELDDAIGMIVMFGDGGRPPSRAVSKEEVGIARALYDFEPNEPGEGLSFKKGNMLEILDWPESREEDGWCRVRIQGQKRIGLAPLEYLQEIGYFTVKSFKAFAKTGFEHIPSLAISPKKVDKSNHAQKMEELKLALQVPEP